MQQFATGSTARTSPWSTSRPSWSLHGILVLKFRKLLLKNIAGKKELQYFVNLGVNSVILGGICVVCFPFSSNLSCGCVSPVFEEMLGRCEEFRDQLCASQAKKAGQNYSLSGLISTDMISSQFFIYFPDIS